MKKTIYLTILAFAFLCLKPELALASDAKKQRIISLAPATTEILFRLGLADEIVGVTTFCNYPPQAKSKEKVGTFSQPDIEKILSLKPDIIFATGLEQALVVEKLRQLKLNVCVSDPANIEELLSSIRNIAALTHKEKEAGLLIAQMRKTIDRVRLKSKNIPQNQRLKVFIEIWDDPLMTAGQGSFVDELITIAGGINISHQTPRPFSYFSPEQVIKQDPDCIILGHQGDEKVISKIHKRLGWEKIKAVKNNRIYIDINTDLFLRPGPRLIEGLEEIQKRLYPK